jgi:hypothetical protein
MCRTLWLLSFSLLFGAALSFARTPELAQLGFPDTTGGPAGVPDTTRGSIMLPDTAAPDTTRGAIIVPDTVGVPGAGMPVPEDSTYGDAGRGMMDHGSQMGQVHSEMVNPLAAEQGIDRILRLRRELDLTDEQVSKLQNLRLDYVRKSSDIQRNLNIARAELMNAEENPRTRANDLEKRIRNIYNLAADLEVERARAIRETWSVLDDTQQSYIAQNAPDLVPGIGLARDAGGE